jgi:uncharacterized membrane protein
MTDATTDPVRSLPEKVTSLTRMEALSDGVFGVALTLLVIDIKIPDHAPGDPLRVLIELGPQILVYALSYLVVAYTWMWHHMIFDLIKRSTRLLIWMNLILLLPVAFLPFSASFVSRYPTSGVAVAVYGADLSLFSLVLIAIWNYACRERLFADETDQATMSATRRRVHLLAALSIGSTVIGLFFPIAGLILFALAPIGYVATGGRHTIG